MVQDIGDGEMGDVQSGCSDILSRRVTSTSGCFKGRGSLEVWSCGHVVVTAVRVSHANIAHHGTLSRLATIHEH